MLWSPLRGAGGLALEEGGKFEWEARGSKLSCSCETDTYLSSSEASEFPCSSLAASIEYWWGWGLPSRLGDRIGFPKILVMG